MTSNWRMLAVIAAVGAFALGPPFGRWTARETDAGAGRTSAALGRGLHSDPVVDARLGGTRESFGTAYGAPVLETADGPRYTIPRLGFVDVQYQPTVEPHAGDLALIIKIQPPRPDGKPVSTPDAADWSLTTARTLTMRFLPRDAQLGGATPAGARRLAARCQSVDLAQLFPDSPDPGACQISYTTPTAQTVSFITLTLGNGVDATPTAALVDPCAGLAVWGAATATRMRAATRLLGQVSQLNDDNATATTLRKIAQKFAALEEAQRAAAPGAAITANQALVDLFAAYHDALDLAATGLATQDVSAANQAAAQITATNKKVKHVGALMEVAFGACGLPIAIPAA